MRRVVLDEANALGTCDLRAGLQGASAAGRLRDMLRRHTVVRIEHFDTGDDPAAAGRTSAEMARQLDALGAEVTAATRDDPAAVRTAAIIPAVNAVIDLDATRAWSVAGHLPPPVLVLLLAGVLVSSLLIGHSSGQARRRHGGLWLAFNLLFALVLFVVLDFDRPRRGLIRVDHTPLIDLMALMDRDAAAASPTP